ncbi:MAG: glycosyltransferase family 2 protein [Janthinobacterium lividum]
MEDHLDAAARTGPPARLFSIGIPVFNGKALLRSCLESVLASSFPHERYEILVADDGSSEPETLAILAEFRDRLAAEPGFFTVISLGTNSGGAARPRNRILDEATGEYVFFIDSDDTIGSLALERIADALATTPADWVALHQVLVNGRVGAATVKQPRMEVTRVKAMSTLTVHKVFRRAEIGRQRLQFDEGLPSGQDVSFAFSYLLNASKFLMLGGYDYYYLTRHAGDPNEPAHLSRRANTPGALIEKNHRILSSMLSDLHRSTLTEAERRQIVCDVVLPRVLVQQRYLKSIVGEGPRPGSRALRRLADLLTDPLVAGVEPADLKKGFTADHLAVVRAADWVGLRDLLKQSGPVAPPPKAAPKLTQRWVRRGRRVADMASGWASHRRLAAELGQLRRTVEDLQKAQLQLEAEVRTELRRPEQPAGRRSSSDGENSSAGNSSAGSSAGTDLPD